MWEVHFVAVWVWSGLTGLSNLQRLRLSNSQVELAVDRVAHEPLVGIFGDFLAVGFDDEIACV